MTKITFDAALAAKYLKSGKVCALPTETVYGLGASIYQEKALLEIFHLKKRPSDNPLIVHVLDIAMASKIAYITPEFLKLYEAFMPGPLTVLLQKKQVSDSITRGLETVGIRIPSHPLFLDVLRILDEPIAAPSANLSGKPSSTEAAHVYHDFAPDLPLILDGGSCISGIESTIVAFDEGEGIILRPGAIPKEDLEKATGLRFQFAKKNAVLRAPGMKYRHYSPQASVILVYDENRLPKSDSGALIMAETFMECPHFEILNMQNLYRAFRKADDLGLKTIYVLISNNLGEGLKNRLEKAAD
jgi:L-threonylcarbamoyladenylate synthase